MKRTGSSVVAKVSAGLGYTDQYIVAKLSPIVWRIDVFVHRGRGNIMFFCLLIIYHDLYLVYVKVDQYFIKNR